MGHFAAGGASGGFGLSHEHDGKVIRKRHVSESRRSANACPCALLSPISRIRRSHKAPFLSDGCGWLFERNDKLSLGFKSAGSFVLPIAGEPARGSTSDADNHG
jgi:hypothetical protein